MEPPGSASAGVTPAAAEPRAPAVTPDSPGSASAGVTPAAAEPSAAQTTAAADRAEINVVAIAFASVFGVLALLVVGVRGRSAELHALRHLGHLTLFGVVAVPAALGWGLAFLGSLGFAVHAVGGRSQVRQPHRTFGICLGVGLLLLVPVVPVMSFDRGFGGENRLSAQAVAAGLDPVQVAALHRASLTALFLLPIGIGGARLTLFRKTHRGGRRGFVGLVLMAVVALLIGAIPVATAAADSGETVLTKLRAHLTATPQTYLVGGGTLVSAVLGDCSQAATLVGTAVPGCVDTLVVTVAERGGQDGTYSYVEVQSGASAETVAAAGHVDGADVVSENAVVIVISATASTATANELTSAVEQLS